MLMLKGQNMLNKSIREKQMILKKSARNEKTFKQTLTDEVKIY